MNTSAWLIIHLLLFAAPAAANPGVAGADEVRVQFCWAFGNLDHTIYFAEAEGREDRQASFVSLLDISAIDHHSVECWVADLNSYRLRRTALMKKWSELEFEIVNTTFLSDLDY